MSGTRQSSACKDIETIKSDVLHVRVELFDFKRETRRRFDDLETKIDGVTATMERHQAQIVTLLSELVGRSDE